jgi:hypothetical protein
MLAALNGKLDVVRYLCVVRLVQRVLRERLCADRRAGIDASAAELGWIDFHGTESFSTVYDKWAARRHQFDDQNRNHFHHLLKNLVDTKDKVSF